MYSLSQYADVALLFSRTYTLCTLVCAGQVSLTFINALYFVIITVQLTGLATSAAGGPSACQKRTSGCYNHQIDRPLP